LVITSLSTRGIVGLISAVAGLVLGVFAGDNIRKQQRPTPLFWFSFLFHAFSIGFSDTPLSGFVSLLILGSGLPSLVTYLGPPDVNAIDLQELAPVVVAFFVAKAFAVVGLGYVNKTLLAAVGIWGMTGHAPPGRGAAKSRPSGSQPRREVERREAEPFTPETDVDACKYTPAFLAAWREMHKADVSECPEELKNQRLQKQEAPPPQARPAGKGGAGRGKGGPAVAGGKGKAQGKGLGKGGKKGEDGIPLPEIRKVLEDGQAEVGNDIRWNVIAEEMARIDADSHKSPLADMVLDDD